MVMFSTANVASPNFDAKIYDHLSPCLHLPRLPQRFDGLLLTALVIVFPWVQMPSALASQAKSLVNVVIGYGSTDGGVAVLGFAQERVCKRGLVRDR
jgi:hypothetical protein